MSTRTGGQVGARSVATKRVDKWAQGIVVPGRRGGGVLEGMGMVAKGRGVEIGRGPKRSKAQRCG